MVSKIMSLLPFIVVPTIFFVSASIGITLLLSSRDTIIERYQNLVYSFTDRAPERERRSSYKNVILTSRIAGFIAICTSVAAGVFAATNMMGG